MRTDLSSALQAAHAGAVQKPAWLVEITWASSTSRSSSHGEVTMGGNTWLAADVDVSRIVIEDARVSGSLVFGNADDAWGSQVLTDGVSGRQIRIWGYDANATAADADFLLMVRCVGGRATVTPELVTIGLRDNQEYSYSPRKFVAAPTFTHLLPAGSKITINGQTYEVNR